MNESPSRIEILKPFSEAIELTRVMLFQPFNLSKWCVIGFAAFLSNLGGGGFSFNYNFGNWGGSGSSQSSGSSPFFRHDMLPWVLGAVVVVAVLVIVMVLALLWVGCRGKFIFTDCVVRNRAAIAEPWREYGKEGNSLFLFSLVAMTILAASVTIVAIPVVLIWLKTQTDGFSWPGLIALLIVAPLFVVLLVFWAFVRELMSPVMYRQRGNALSAFRQVLRLVRQYPGEIILYFLFLLALGLGTAVAVVFLMCATCCIVLIPYVGTVIMLPIFVLFRAYMLLFLRQFGPDYDVWGGLSPMAPPAQPSPAPPAPEPPALPAV